MFIIRQEQNKLEVLMKSFRLPIKVALVDDDKMSLTAQAAMLNEIKDIEIVKFESAENCLMHIVQNEDVGIVIADINLPGIPGEILVEKIINLHQAIDVIVVTGSQSITKTLPCILYGAREVLNKPVAKQDLVDAVELSVNRFRKIVSYLQRPKTNL